VEVGGRHVQALAAMPLQKSVKNVYHAVRFVVDDVWNTLARQSRGTVGHPRISSPSGEWRGSYGTTKWPRHGILGHHPRLGVKLVNARILGNQPSIASPGCS